MHRQNVFDAIIAKQLASVPASEKLAARTLAQPYAIKLIVSRQTRTPAQCIHSPRQTCISEMELLCCTSLTLPLQNVRELQQLDCDCKAAQSEGI